MIVAIIMMCPEVLKHVQHAYRRNETCRDYLAIVLTSLKDQDRYRNTVLKVYWTKQAPALLMG
jgi:hypothetical protein